MILIADSGSTKTDWRLLEKGRPVGQIRTTGFNPYYQDTTAIASELRTNLLPYCTSKVTDVFYYGTGITGADKANVLRRAIREVFDSVINIDVESDVVGAARAACGHEKGIACILGTGSNSCYFDGEKITFQIPPLGFWLGDEGSGGHMGKWLILAYLHEEMPIEIKRLFEETYGVMDRLPILENAYHKPFPNRYFASFAKFLHINIEHEFCHNLVSDSFGQFFEKYVLKYPMCFEAGLNFVGSVAFYFEQILRTVAKNKSLRVDSILAAPIDGLVQFHTPNNGD